MEDPFDKIELHISKGMDNLESKLDTFLDGPFNEVSTSKKGPPGPPEPPMPFDPEDVADKLSEGVDRAVEPLRMAAQDIGEKMDKGAEKAKKIGKSMNKVFFPFQLISSPASVIIFAKNVKDNPNKSTDELIDMTNKETIGWALDVANVAWPGTAAPRAKDDFRERIGGVVKTFTKEQIFE